jgi:hypothetical protein
MATSTDPNNPQGTTQQQGVQATSGQQANVWGSTTPTNTTGAAGGGLVAGQLAAGTPGQAQTPVNTPAPNDGTGGASTNSVGASTAPALADTSALSGSSQAGDLVSQLIGRSNESLAIDPTTDPIIRPQVDAYEAQQTRTARNLIDQAAESGNPYATGAVQNTRAQAAEQAGANTASLQSQLTQNELTARRGEIQNALSEQGSLLTAQQQASLQQELGLLDASLNQQGINSRNDQFAAQLGLQTDQQNNYWNAINSGLITG